MSRHFWINEEFSHLNFWQNKTVRFSHFLLYFLLHFKTVTYMPCSNVAWWTCCQTSRRREACVAAGWHLALGVNIMPKYGIKIGVLRRKKEKDFEYHQELRLSAIFCSKRLILIHNHCIIRQIFTPSPCSGESGISGSVMGARSGDGGSYKGTSLGQGEI